MAKKYKLKKGVKKVKKLNSRRKNSIKVPKFKRPKVEQVLDSNLLQENQMQKSEDEKILNNLLEAQAVIKLLCCICNKDIAHQIKIILEPISNNFKIHQKGLLFNSLCVDCFVSKTKYDSKTNFYYVVNDMTLNCYLFMNYRILKKMSEPLFTYDWSLGDEIKLLGAIEKMGLDNWDEISKILNKGIFECEAHYYTFYYKGKDDYLPDDKNYSNINTEEILNQNKIKENKLLLNIENNIGYIPFAESNKLKRTLAKNYNIKNNSEEKSKINNINTYDTLGYWTKRKEYEVEYKNEAEILMSEIEFKDSDAPRTINMYYKILQNYNNILEEREERKKLICDKNLFDVKKQINFDKKLSNEDREIYTNSKNNIKYLTKEQFYYVYESNVLEKNLKEILNQLILYRNLGCKTFEDIQKYIYELKKENNKNKNEGNDLADEKMKLRDSSINVVKMDDNNKILSKKN